MLFILSTLLGVFSVNGDTASISFDRIWQQDTIRIQFSLGEHNYTTSAHCIFKLEKDRDRFKTAYYFSNHMDYPAEFKKNINFSKNDIERLIKLFIEIKKEEETSGWICWYPLKFSYVSINHQNKKHSLIIYDEEKIESIKSILFGKIYIEHFSTSLSKLKIYWKQ